MPEEPQSLLPLNETLDDFRVVVMTEVYKVDDGGRQTETVGVFADPQVAQAYIDTEDPRGDYHRTAPVHILTDGKVGFKVDPTPVTLIDCAIEKQRLRDELMRNMTSSQAFVLGITPAPVSAQ